MSTEAERREANAKIADLIKVAQDALAEATKIADVAGVRFDWDGPTGDNYGMGGTYKPTNEWDSSSCTDYDESGWKSSSSEC